MIAAEELRLVFGLDGSGRLLALVVCGSTILDVEVVAHRAEADQWFEQVKVTRPWETRQ